MDWVDSEELGRTVRPFPKKQFTINGTVAASASEALTNLIVMGGNAKRMIMVINHVLLFDSAYARSAEKATDKFGLVYKCCENQELGLTAE